MASTIYGRKDVADYLGVTQTAVSNWIHRYSNTPKPQYETPDGVRYWSKAGRESWRAWYLQGDWKWRTKPPTAEGRKPKSHYFPTA